MPLVNRRVTSASSLKALAHPLRLALLELLVARGPLTASEAAGEVGASPSNCSWHLRKLSAHGFVREAPGGTGRDRPWRAVREGIAWAWEDETVDPSAAEEGLADLLLERELQRYRAARSQRAGETSEWREATGLQQGQLWLTAEQAGRITDYISSLLRSGSSAEGAQQRPEGARLVSLVSWLVPAGPARQHDEVSGS